MALLLESVLNGMFVGAIYSLMALGFVIPFMAMRVPNFALGELVLFGGAFAGLGYAVLGSSVLLGLLFGVAALGVWLLGFNRLVFSRISGSRTITLLMLTLGLGAFMQGVAGLFAASLPPPMPLPLPRQTLIVWDMYLYPDEAIAGVVALLASAAMGGLFRWTRFGVALRALSGDSAIAMAMGIRPTRYNALAWTLAGAAAVVAGAMWADLRGPGFSFTLVGLKVLPIVIIGGMDRLAGAFVGGIVMGVVDNLAATYVDRWTGISMSQVTPFLLLIAVMLVRPHGLFGSPEIERV